MVQGILDGDAIFWVLLQQLWDQIFRIIRYLHPEVASQRVFALAYILDYFFWEFSIEWQESYYSDVLINQKSSSTKSHQSKNYRFSSNTNYSPEFQEPSSLLYRKQLLSLDSTRSAQRSSQIRNRSAWSTWSNSSSCRIKLEYSQASSHGELYQFNGCSLSCPTTNS
jgi:hypothetical protein